MATALVEQKGICNTGDESPQVAEEEVESVPSTEIGSNDSDSDYSDDDDDCGVTLFSVQDTVLIFDWDDTVLPSTWVHEQGLRLDAECVPTLDQEEKLNTLALQAANTLWVAKSFGQVILVTNAERGWIELSCQKFMPSLYPYLENVKIMSARSTYEQQGVASPFEWKFLAFESELSDFYKLFPSDRRKNVISIGDSAHEREALFRATELMTACCTKSFKFAERPEVEQLVKEHELISGCLKHIVNHDGNLDLSIKCS